MKKKSIFAGVAVAALICCSATACVLANQSGESGSEAKSFSACARWGCNDAWHTIFSVAPPFFKPRLS